MAARGTSAAFCARLLLPRSNQRSQQIGRCASNAVTKRQRDEHSRLRLTAALGDSSPQKRGEGVSRGGRTPSRSRRKDDPRGDTTQLPASSDTPSPPPFRAVVLSKGRSRMFYEGNSIVWQHSIDKVSDGELPNTGSTAIEMLPLVDHNSHIIGWGAYNRSSKFAMRMLHWCAVDGAIDALDTLSFDVYALVHARVRRAIQMRRRLGLPNADTNVFRLVNSEGDRLSGLCVDVFGDVAVLEASATWLEEYRAVIIDAVESALGSLVSRIVWSRNLDKLRQDGFEDHINENEEGDGAESADEEIIAVRENALTFEISLQRGQKTGFYCDQRENRAALQAICLGADVLDCFAFTGGFALHAAAAGAASVVAVESSLRAIKTAQENLARNHPTLRIDWQKSTVEQYLRDAKQLGAKWDVVILDPPKLAPTQKSIPQATRKYRSLNRAAFDVIRPGGVLLTCTCSRAMTASGNFLEVVRSAALEAKRQISVLRVSGPAADHPFDASMPESKYLTAVWVAVTS